MVKEEVRNLAFLFTETGFVLISLIENSKILHGFNDFRRIPFFFFQLWLQVLP